MSTSTVHPAHSAQSSKGLRVMGYIGGFLIPLSAVTGVMGIWFYQLATQNPLYVVSLALVIITNLLVLGAMYGRVSNRLDNMATKTDLLELELKLLDKFQTKEGCEDKHNGN